MSADFRILGPVEVEVDGSPVPLQRQQTRHLLALLLLEIGRPVPIRRLIDLMWPEGAPVNARAVLQTTVSRLRATVAHLSIALRGEAYVLEADPQCVDASRFRRLVEQASRTPLAKTRADLAREALALWRGPALADVGTDATREQVGAALEEIRQRALDLRISADLELGQHAELVGELTDLVAADPLNERLVVHLVVALYRSGRRSDALGTCHRARAALADQLGLDPGSTLERLEVAVLRGDPALDLAGRGVDSGGGDGAAPVPAQLPAAATDLFGRAAEIDRLDELLDAATARTSAPGLVVITGAPGVGKTTLALRWGHAVADRFPDGQLYVNLRGFGPDEPAKPGTALAGFLAALGMDHDAIPLDADQAAAAYRTRLGGRRMLLILDNAADVEQVRPLLPGGAGCFTVVTSRDSLTGLVARDGATSVQLRPLGEADAAALLARMVGEARLGQEPGAARDLVRACGGLPLALRIVGAQLVDSPHRTVSDHLRRVVAGTPLRMLELADDPDSAVRVTFDHSYRVLAARTRQVFGALGVVALPAYCPDVVAALADIDPADAAEHLEQLRRGHLVDGAPSGRYVLHDLLRQYAHEHAIAGAVGNIEQAAQRLYDQQLRRVLAAADILFPQLVRLPDPAGRVDGFRFESRAAALEWLDAELPGIVMLVQHALDQGHWAAVVALSDSLRGYFWLTSRTVEWFTVANAALRAAKAADDPRGQCAAQLSLGLAYLCTSQYAAAAGSHEDALVQSRRSGWQVGEAASLGGLGTVYMQLGRLDSAAERYREAIAMYRQLGREVSVPGSRANLALVLQMWGRLEESAEEMAAVIEYQRSATGQLASVALNLANLARVERDLGRYGPAEEHLREGLRLTSEAGNLWAHAVCDAWLGSIYRDMGDLVAAERELMAAVDLMSTVDAASECDIQHTLASVWRARGELTLALAAQERAAELAQQVGNQYQIVETAIGLAEVHLAMADPATAARHAEPALAAASRLGYRQYEGEAHNALAAIALATNRPADALAHATAALELHRACAYPLGQARAARLLSASNSAGQELQEVIDHEGRPDEGLEHADHP